MAGEPDLGSGPARSVAQGPSVAGWAIPGIVGGAATMNDAHPDSLMARSLDDFRVSS
jgi:hypothetical protein